MGLAAEPDLWERVVWAQGVAALTRGENSEVDQFVTTLRAGRPDTIAVLLGTSLEALQQGAAEQFQRAVDLSAPLLALDSAARGGDPFARAVLHMKRAEWLEALGDYDAADSASLWYEHFEIIRIPQSEPAMAADIDWAIAPYALWRRGIRAATFGNRWAACAQLPRVVEFWTDADPPHAALRDSASAVISNLGCNQ